MSLTIHRGDVRDVLPHFTERTCASDDMYAILFLLRRRVHSCDTYNIKPPDFRGFGYVYSDLYGERRACLLFHHNGSISLLVRLFAWPVLRTGRDTEHSDSFEKAGFFWPLGALVSTMQKSLRQHQEGSRHLSSDEASLLAPRSSFCDEIQCVDMEVCNWRTVLNALERRRTGKDVFCSALECLGTACLNFNEKVSPFRGLAMCERR